MRNGRPGVVAGLALALAMAAQGAALAQQDDLVTEAMGLYAVRAYALTLMQHCLDNLAFDPAFKEAQAKWEERNRPNFTEVDAVVALQGDGDPTPRQAAEASGTAKAHKDADVFMLYAYCTTMRDVINSGSYDVGYRFKEVTDRIHQAAEQLAQEPGVAPH